MLDPAFCRKRQGRLLDAMQGQRLDAVVLGQPRHVYYFSGHRPFWSHESAFVQAADGHTCLLSANEPNPAAAADENITFEANWFSTQRQEHPAVAADRVTGLLKGRRARRIGVDGSDVTSHVTMGFEGESETIEPTLWQLRRRKDPDELALMKTAIACTGAMYRRAREIIEPGIPELRVYAELHRVAVETAGEPLWPAHLGNDFACGVPGGPPRKDRTAQAGELYILDLGPAYRGYFSDNSRAFAVNRKPTDAQMEAWRTVTDALKIVERMAKPGVRCRDIFAAADEHYRARTDKAFPHHLGHGVGLQPHEYPHLNPRWDDTLMEGEVFTAEPGLYGAELAGGLRIENDYLVTATGVENLSNFPVDL
jgi:Xaa-Pro dipeptidase